MEFGENGSSLEDMRLLIYFIFVPYCWLRFENDGEIQPEGSLTLHWSWLWERWLFCWMVNRIEAFGVPKWFFRDCSSECLKWVPQIWSGVCKCIHNMWIYIYISTYIIYVMYGFQVKPYWKIRWTNRNQRSDPVRMSHAQETQERSRDWSWFEPGTQESIGDHWGPL